MKDFYKILGVDQNADQKAIKKAYRRLAQKYHPDRNPDDPSAEDKFKEITEAYSTLSDLQKRQEYDFSRSFGSSQRLNNINDFPDIFSSMFGGHPFGEFFTNPRTSQRPKPKREEDVEVTFKVNLKDLKGAGSVKKTFKLRYNITCDSCEGKGGKSTTRCDACNGLGVINERYVKGTMSYQNTRACNTCAGQGFFILNPCKACNATGTIQKIETYDVNITSKLRKQ